MVDEWLRGDFDVDPYITHNMTHEQINTAFDLLHAGKSIRSVIHIQPSDTMLANDHLAFEQAHRPVPPVRWRRCAICQFDVSLALALVNGFGSDLNLHWPLIELFGLALQKVRSGIDTSIFPFRRLFAQLLSFAQINQKAPLFRRVCFIKH